MPEVSIDFDEPRFGPVCVHAVAGDTLKFQWDEWHNLHELPDFEAYESCDFAGAVELADAAPNPAGVFVAVPLSGEADLYFSCSKICASHGHKVHVCVAPDTNSTCECDEPVPTPRPTGPTVGPSASSAPSTSAAPTAARVAFAQASSARREAHSSLLLAVVLCSMVMRRFIAHR